MNAIIEQPVKERPEVIQWLNDHPHFGGGYFEAEAAFDYELKTAAQIAARRRAPASAPEAPWRTSPTLVEIQTAMRTFGLSTADAEQKVRGELVADAQRLAQWRPEAASEISAAIEVADEARQKSDALIFEHQQWIDGLKGLLGTLGSLRATIRHVQTLNLDGNQERHLAHAALRYFVAKKSGGLTVENESGWKENSNELVIRLALQKHLSPFCEELEKQALEIVAEIRNVAKLRKFDLGRFILLSLEDQKASEGTCFDVSLFRDLFDRPKCEA